ncbi:hypothetical protein DZC78_01090 [Olleya aquimaris]|nr:hypothetical protein DZC78_01090 [Olleya aquimaris]
MKKLLTFILISCSITAYCQDKTLVLSLNNYQVFQDTTQKTYTIVDSNNNIIVQDLKYVNYAGFSQSLQTLDKSNNIIYYDNTLKQIETPKEGIMTVCGTVAYFKRKITEDKNNYYVEFTKDNSVYNNGITKTIVDTIPKTNIKQIYFANTKKEIDYDENFYFPTVLILKLENTIAIKDNDSIKYYDSIDLNNPLAIKVKKGNLLGLYGITDIKFKQLENFKYNLAKFTDANGKIGYIDLLGNEY